MKHVMVDLEYLGWQNDAIVPQVGIIIADDNFIPIDSLGVNISVTDSLLRGFSTDESTLKFWAKQQQDVKDAVFPKDSHDLHIASQIIHRFFIKHLDGVEFKLWSNHLLCDFPKLDNLMTKMGYKSITSRTKVTWIEDYASVRNLTKSLYPDEYESAISNLVNLNPHEAVSDCIYQLGVLRACHEILGHRIRVPELGPLTGDTNNSVHGGVILEPQQMQPIQPFDDPLMNPPEFKDDGPKWEDEFNGGV